MEFYVLTYPDTMPEDGEFGTDQDYYDQFYAGAFVAKDYASGGYPYPEKAIGRGAWFDTQELAEIYAGDQKHFTVKKLTVELSDLTVAENKKEEK